MLTVLEFLGTGLSFYRATEDSGMWLWRENMEAIQHYMEMFLVSKGALD